MTRPSTEWRYYISSKVLDAAQFSEQIQAHWQIENRCHWVLDVSFDEDGSRVRRDHGAQNLAVLRRISLNLFQQDKAKGSIKVKRKRAAWSTGYLGQVFGLVLRYEFVNMFCASLRGCTPQSVITRIEFSYEVQS